MTSLSKSLFFAMAARLTIHSFPVLTPQAALACVTAETVGASIARHFDTARSIRKERRSLANRLKLLDQQKRKQLRLPKPGDSSLLPFSSIANGSRNVIGDCGTVAAAIAHSRRRGSSLIIVEKHPRLLILYRAGHPARLFPVELGFAPLKDKRHAGDGATPEGVYFVRKKRDLDQTAFHRALLLSYPNRADRIRFRRNRRLGLVPAHAGIGGLIEIHGMGSGQGIDGIDWTAGCVALSNADMDILFAHSSVGTRVIIVREACSTAFESYKDRVYFVLSPSPRNDDVDDSRSNYDTE